MGTVGQPVPHMEKPARGQARNLDIQVPYKIQDIKRVSEILVVFLEHYLRLTIQFNDVMPAGAGWVCMTNNDEEWIKTHEKGWVRGGLKEYSMIA